MVDYIGQPFAFKFKWLSKMLTGNFFCAPRVVMIAVTFLFVGFPCLVILISSPGNSRWQSAMKVLRSLAMSALLLIYEKIYAKRFIGWRASCQLSLRPAVPTSGGKRFPSFAHRVVQSEPPA